MREVEVFAYERKDGDTRYTKVFKCLAVFHQFGGYYEEFESGPGNATGAVVEYADGTVEMVDVSMIKFVVPTVLVSKS